MRINYYRFPDTVDATTRYQHGADPIGERGCTANPDGDCPGCPHHEGNWYDCPFTTVEDAEDTVGGITITRAKALLREFGGAAWTHPLRARRRGVRNHGNQAGRQQQQAQIQPAPIAPGAFSVGQAAKKTSRNFQKRLAL